MKDTLITLSKWIAWYLPFENRDETPIEIRHIGYSLNQEPKFEEFDRAHIVKTWVNGEQREVRPSRYFEYMADRVEYMCPCATMFEMWNLFRTETKIKREYKRFIKKQVNP